MKQIWKRNIVAATVLLFVCGAVYLNWKYASSVADPAADQSGKVLGQSTLVSGDNGGETGTEGENIDTEGDSASTSGDYFATARLTRQQARDNAIALLREAAESESADKEVANEAAAAIQVLAGYAVAEAQIENLVTAKGYPQCVAFMGDSSISVVVSPAGETGLEAADVARITDIVLNETDYTAGQITILEAE
ncbi:MAG: SpoIIIAH-like family protein [Oscillospiraceae bacterium]|jgi:stage III sporulation protein AH|nr:SpoIIIAH-like family protein [Oscillospiraceae bacterium]